VKRPLPTIAFLIVLAGAALFVIRSGAALPDLVATHFGATGRGNGFMPRSVYVRFMLGFVVLLPLAINLLIDYVLRLPSTSINIPNREYWLAPDRRGDTVERLQRHMKFFGVMLAVFLCYVHWQVVQANTRMPPTLDNIRFSTGVATFMAALVVWIVVLRRDFRPPPA